MRLKNNDTVINISLVWTVVACWKRTGWNSLQFRMGVIEQASIYAVHSCWIWCCFHFASQLVWVSVYTDTELICDSDNIYLEPNYKTMLQNLRVISLIVCTAFSSLKKHFSLHKTLIMTNQSKSQEQRQNRWQRQPALLSATLSFLKWSDISHIYFNI